MTTQAAAVWPKVTLMGKADDPDLELVRRARQGDVDAFSDLVRRHEGVVYNLAYRFMRDDPSAQDMTQEAFLKAFRMVQGFRGDCAFSTWMYRVTSSVCLTELARRKKRREVALDSHRPDPTETPDPAASDRSEWIRRCVTRLPEPYSTVLVLYYLEQIPYEQIAETLEIPLGTLKTWMHRARKKLRDVVEKEIGIHGPE